MREPGRETSTQEVFLAPLSYAQERLWFLHQLDPHSPRYSVPALAARIRGVLDAAAIEFSLRQIIQRHESLRTTFGQIDGEPAQLVHPTIDFSLEKVDLGWRGDQISEAQAVQLAREVVCRPFDLTRGPLIRAALLRLSATDHILVLPVHHIVFDGWSIGILLRELNSLYRNHVGGSPSTLAEPAIQYADYAQWQRDRFEDEEVQGQLDFWRGQLAGAPQLHQLPLDRPRPAAQTHGGHRLAYSISAELMQALQDLGREEGATLFMVLLAAFQVLLSRYSNQEDIVVGTPIAGREQPETRDVIGFFVNTLVLRGDLSGDPSFRQLLRRCRQMALDAYGHQDVPFDKLVADLRPERSLSLSPLFQVMFILQNAPLSPPTLPGLELTPIEVDTGTTKFDLVLSLLPTDWTSSDLTGWFAYNTEIFDHPTIARMAQHFTILLQAIVEDPDQTIGALPLMSREEQHRQLVIWNQNEHPYPDTLGAHQLFELQVERSPGATAVCMDEIRISYVELNRRANQLAHHLISLGVGPDTIIALCLDRSVDQVVGLLAILKAGGAYVSLDPALPRERLSYMLSDTQAPILLTHSSQVHRLPPSQVETICLDTDLPSLVSCPNSNPELTVTADSLAYVIYTSGSTGVPNGVMVEHGSLCNLVAYQICLFAISPGSRVLQFASLSFDASVSEVFTALSSGATLVLARQEVLASPPELADLLENQAISVVTLPPSMLRLLPERDLPTLHTVVSAGEPCSLEIVGRWAPSRRFINAYGPTETTVGIVHYVVDSNVNDSALHVPIGRPVHNTQAYVLDRFLQPVPIGVVGELYVAGVSLARGYLNSPNQTSRRFASNPFSDIPEDRLYRTGDLVRYLPDGNLVFVGRADQQVKLRGFRTELGEIEVALSEHSAIVQAAAVVHVDSRGSQVLHAFVVPTGHAPSGGDLRAFLQSKLPPHMMPNGYLFLESLPLTNSGKVDRQALLRIAQDHSVIQQQFVAPRTAIEEALADLWQEVLSIDTIGAHDNFFELGGDSILGAILINRLQKKLDQPVYVVALFEAPTVAGLAEYLVQNYGSVVQRIWGAAMQSNAAVARDEDAGVVDRSTVESLARLVPHLADRPETATNLQKNPTAVFVLSPPRSGSTLLRAMLQGHPGLFAPPELELLSFNSLSERRAALDGRFAFWLEGTIRAIMEIRGGSADDAWRIMTEREQNNTITKDFYAELQAWIAPQVLVDKTPAYSLDISILRRMEADFQDAKYIHLLRHPHGAIRSFVKARLEQVFFRYDHSFSRRQLAELVWCLCHQNITRFLKEIPQERKLILKYEDIVTVPQAVMRQVCGFLAIDYHPEMIDPYRGQRMTDGIHPLSKMLGDVRFHEHKVIDPSTAEAWKHDLPEDLLGELTWELAQAIGYQRLRPNADPVSIESLLDQADPAMLEQLLSELERMSEDEATQLAD